jgi:hypothetical protein
MKTVKSSFSILMVCTLLFSLSGCRGDRGPKGEDGNANVATIQFTLHTNDWTGDENRYDTNISVPEITQDIYSNGAVLIYSLYELETPYSFNAIPFTNVNGNTATYMDADIYVGNIDLFLVHTTNGINDTQRPINNYIIKVVIIQGINISYIPDNVKKNYAAARAYFNLK